MKYVLCRPQGGLNDILCQVERCRRYAVRTGRKLVVDTDYRNSDHFKDVFEKYFTSTSDNLILNNPFSDCELDSFSVFPRQLSGRLSSYNCKQRRFRRLRLSRRPLFSVAYYTDNESGVRLCFDFAENYSETIVLHHQAGGGTLVQGLLRQLRLKPWLRERLAERLSALPQRYHAIHVRNTDISSDYQQALADFGSKDIPALFVGSDNRNVVEEFTKRLPQTRVFSFSVLPEVAGTPIHTDLPRGEAETRNADAILDLLTLAMADTLTATSQIPAGGFRSGYSALAFMLHGNRELLNEMLE